MSTDVDPTASQPNPPSEPENEELLESSMTMMEHLEELRTRFVISGVALILGLIISAVPVPGADSLTWKVIQILVVPVEGRIQGIAPGEVLFTYFKIALIVGAALAMPVLIYQALKFVIPALLPHEKKYLWIAVPGVSVSFIAGIAFGYFVLLPFAIAFLMGFGAELIEQKWSFGAYVSTVATLLFWMGLSFETPLVMYFLAKLRVVSVARLQSFRRYALVLAFVAGAIITPTPDPINQTAVSIPLYLLFEIGILLARFA
ncbi:MAG TPA: twin-arginine translocase subunit TatC [Chloroflexota bacterium]|nr:twin-arginine translocase subunit TatC [Chloroflexota bacterium]